MPISRRAFLRDAAAASIVLGLPSLARGLPFREPSSAALRAALARMKKERAYGVAILVPDDPETRVTLGRRLENLIALADADAREVLVEAVLVCAPAGSVETRPGETAVLLDPAGTRVAGEAIDFLSTDPGAASRPAPPKGAPSRLELGLPPGDPREHPAKALDGLRVLLHGEGRLERRAKAALTPEAAKAISRVEDAETVEPEEMQRIWSYLQENFGALAPALVAARMKNEAGGKRSWLRPLFDQRFRRMTGGEAPTDLPFGVEWKSEPLPDPCPPCGMAFAPSRSLKFLKFLTA